MLNQMLKKALPAALSLLLVATLCPVALAADGELDRDALVEKINAVLSDEQKRQEAIYAGQDRSVLCSVCHGADGNSKKPGVPNLASQNPIYLLEQIGKFASGERKNFVMQNLSGGFTMEDRINLAIYFSSNKLKPVEADESLVANGKVIYERQCVNCHGANGRGEMGYARIAGQKIDYLELTLSRFRDLAAQRQKQSDAVRHSALMEQASQNLSNIDIRAVAAFVALMK